MPPTTGHTGLDPLPGDLALVDIESPLGHVPHAPLRLLAAECVEVVDIRGLIGDLEIADTAVALRTGHKSEPTLMGTFSLSVAPTLPRICGNLTSVAVHCPPQTHLPELQPLIAQRTQSLCPENSPALPVEGSWASTLWGLETRSGSGQQSKWPTTVLSASFKSQVSKAGG